MLTDDNEGCLPCCGEQGYPVATLLGEQRRSGRKPYRTMDTECLAAAGYLELWRHCVTRLQMRPMGVRTEGKCCRTAVWPAAGSVICTHCLLWFVCRLSCGRTRAGLVRRLWTYQVMSYGTLRRQMTWLAWRHYRTPA